MAEIYSLEQAMDLLQMGRNRLRRWCDKLGITPTPHQYDGRVRLITAEQVQAIRVAAEATDQVLTHRITLPPPSPPVESHYSASQPIIPPLPDGWVSLNAMAERCHVDRRDLKGKEALFATPGHWKIPHHHIYWALDPDQQAHFIQTFVSEVL